MNRIATCALVGALFAGTLAPSALNAQTIFTGTGTAGATTSLNSFRTAIGGVNNGTAPPPHATGRREINWDGVALNNTDFGGNVTVIDNNKTVGIAVNRFQARGALFEEVYAVSGDGFASVNPGTAGQFPAFSPTKTFAMFNDTSIGMSFVFASNPATAPIQAGTRGFGAIFLDVETANTSSIEYFNGSTSLGKFFVPVGGSTEPEFLGVLFDSPIVTSVELTVGTDVLFSFNGSTFTPGGSEDLRNGHDFAVVDDFIFAEPVQAVPEPSAYGMMGAGLFGAVGFVRRLRKKASRA